MNDWWRVPDNKNWQGQDFLAEQLSKMHTVWVQHPGLESAPGPLPRVFSCCCQIKQKWQKYNLQKTSRLQMRSSSMPFIVMNCRNACGSSTGSAEFGNSSKAESLLTFPTSRAPSPPTPAPGDLSQIKDGKVNKSKPCQTLWLTHQKFPQQRSTLLPSLPTNLAESEGSPLIHASQSALNQPLIKREHAKVSSNIFAGPIHSWSQTNRRKQDLFVFTASRPWCSLSNILSLLGLVVGPPFVSHPPIANTKQTFSCF